MPQKEINRGLLPARLRGALSFILLAVALAAGAYYVLTHRVILNHLAQISWIVSVTVFFLYLVMFGVLLLILKASMNICARKLKSVENAVINAHSLFINFFVPGQGGSAYRGLRLRQLHGLRIKNYIIVTLFYYLLYAILSTALMLAGNVPWWQTTLSVILIGVAGTAIVHWYSKRSRVGQHQFRVSPQNIFFLLFATGLQAAVQTFIYGVELRSVNSQISLTQMLTYTGAANLTLFAALTPGAIGIRESFLIFTKHLHHISSANIVEANLIDRGVYIVFLLILLLIVFGSNVVNRRQKRESGEKPRSSEPINDNRQWTMKLPLASEVENFGG